MGYEFTSIEAKERHRQANIRKNKQLRIDNINRYNQNPNICKKCQKMLDYDDRNKKFCNRSCAASHTNKKRASSKHCLFCNKSLSKNRKYCSTDCQKMYNYITYIQLWKIGINDGSNGGDGISDYIRRYFFEKYDKRCQECGWGMNNVYTGMIPLALHHIDGNYRNNKENNLELLCPNCHSLTDNYGSRNIGNGREGRKEWRSG